MDAEPRRPRWIPLLWLATFLVLGLPYWRIPYHALNLPDALETPALLLVCVGALAIRLRGERSRDAWIVGAMVPAVVLARVVVDCLHDASAHNLWPFEAIIATGMGVACAGAGILVGRMLGGGGRDEADRI